ncbi:MAG: sulfatase [Armatimonadota bacterium]|nr:sulfatase [Armatimonadota bacterium]
MNVIVIVADSLRKDHLGCYGNDWIRTPNLDRLAAESCVIDGAYADSLNTIPCRTSMWTGRICFPFRPWQPLEQEDLPIAEWLWDKGYTSALITDVYHMHKPGYNMGRGFDETLFVRGQEYDPWVRPSDVDPAEIDAGLERHFKPTGDAERSEDFAARFRHYLRNISGRESEEDYFCAQVCLKGIDWLERHRGQDRLFLWLDMFDPHEPWDPPLELKEPYNPGYEGLEIIDPVPSEVEGYLTPEEMQNVRALYAGEVTLVDRWVGRLLDAAREMGFLDSSVIVFTSDHGEPLDDHGIVRKARPWLYEELAAVPLLVRLPDGAGAGQRREALVRLSDIAPTICDAVGVDRQPGIHGTSLLPLVRGETDWVRDYAITGIHSRSAAIRDGRWSLLLPGASGQRELYDREQDPAEQHDVAHEFPQEVDRLEEQLQRELGALRWE